MKFTFYISSLNLPSSFRSFDFLLRSIRLLATSVMSELRGIFPLSPGIYTTISRFIKKCSICRRLSFNYSFDRN